MSRVKPFLQIILISAAISGGATYYIGSHLVRALPPDSLLRLLLWGILIKLAAVLWTATFGRVLLRRGEPKDAAVRALDRSVHWIGFVFMGFAAVLLALFPLLDLMEGTMQLTHLFSRQIAEAEGARSDFFQWAPWGAFGIASVCTLIGMYTALKGPKTRRVTVSKAGLAESMRGLKIAQISDLHIGEMIRRGYVERMVNQVLALKPDLIAITGDIADGDPVTLADSVEPLKKLQAPLGTYYVAGNHEFYYGVKAWIQTFKQFGFHVVHNTHRAVSRSNGGHTGTLLVSGISDPMGRKFDPSFVPDGEAAVRGAPRHDYHVFLSHQPQCYPEAERAGCDLMLSGHTHAGQFFPASLFIRYFHRYPFGLHRHLDKFWVYVNQGTGFWGPPNRLGVPAEVTLLEVQAA